MASQDNSVSNFSQENQTCILRTASCRCNHKVPANVCVRACTHVRVCVHVALLHLLARPCCREGSGLHGRTHRSVVTRCFLCGSHRVKQESTELPAHFCRAGSCLSREHQKYPGKVKRSSRLLSPVPEACGIRPQTERLQRVASSASD